MDKSKITLTINNDCSTLTNGFSSINKNQQIFKIQKTVTLENTEKNFPNWLQGRWQFLDVNMNHLIFRDTSSFKSYRMFLVNQLTENKFIVLSRSLCGEISYKCLWIRKLDENILEFLSSSETTEKLTNDKLCNDEYFDEKQWTTQSSNL